MAYPYPDSSTAPVANPVSIINPLFCTPQPVELAIVRKVFTLTNVDFVVTDINGNIIFKVKSPFFAIHGKRVLLDAAGNPIVTLKQKLMSIHQRWKVFRGDSTNSSDLLFSAKLSSMFQWKTKLDVFLANNTEENVCDFKVKGSWFQRSCVIYAGESSTIVAQMHKKNSLKSTLIGKDKFMVTVYPNIDYAFIVAIILILDCINSTGASGASGDG